MSWLSLLHRNTRNALGSAAFVVFMPDYSCSCGAHDAEPLSVRQVVVPDGPRQQVPAASAVSALRSSPASSIPGLEAELSRVTRERPELAEVFASLRVVRTRAGQLRLLGNLADRDLAPLLLAGIAWGPESAELRAALAEALPRTGGDYAGFAIALLGSRIELEVRVALLYALGKVADSSALDGFALALEDTEPRLRAGAARGLGRRADGVELREQLVERLHDSDQRVRAAAAHSLGTFRDGAFGPALSSMLDDPAPEVRRAAARALSRIGSVTRE